MYDFSNITVEGIEREVEAAVAAAEELASGATNPDQAPTYDNTVGPIDEIIDVIRKAQHRAEFMRQVHPDTEVRDAATQANDVLKTWCNSLRLPGRLNSRSARRSITLSNGSPPRRKRQP